MAEEFDWFGILQAMKGDAMVEFTSFYSSTIASLGPDSAVGRACLLPGMALSPQPEPPSVSDCPPPGCGGGGTLPIEGGGAAPDAGGGPVPGGAPEIRGIAGDEGRRSGGSISRLADLSFDSEADHDQSAADADSSPAWDSVFLNDGHQYNCFLNSMLQCLFGFGHLRAALLERMTQLSGHRCVVPPTCCVPCQLLRLSQAYTNARSETVLDPTPLRAAMAASSSGLMQEVIRVP